MFLYCSVSLRIFMFWKREWSQRIHNEEIILFCVLIELKYSSTLIVSSKAPQVISSCSFKSMLPLWIQNKRYLSLKFHEGNKRKDDSFVMKQIHPGMRNLIITDCWAVLVINMPCFINDMAPEIHFVNCSQFTFWLIFIIMFYRYWYWPKLTFKNREKSSITHGVTKGSCTLCLFFSCLG